MPEGYLTNLSLLRRFRDPLVCHSLLREVDEECRAMAAMLLPKPVPHPEAVNQCASGWSANEAGSPWTDGLSSRT